MTAPGAVGASGAVPPPSARAAALLRQVAAIQSSPERWMQPVGIIGPGNGGEAECSAAYRVAHALADAGMAIICGGRGGVMEAASRGAHDAGGIAIGILPEEDTRNANRYLTVAVPTGIGEMRNALIARSSLFLVAIGGGMGTISEMALGLKWEKQVFAWHPDVELAGLQIARDVDELIELAAAALIRLRS